MKTQINAIRLGSPKALGQEENQTPTPYAEREKIMKAVHEENPEEIKLKLPKGEIAILKIYKSVTGKTVYALGEIKEETYRKYTGETGKTKTMTFDIGLTGQGEIRFSRNSATKEKSSTTYSPQFFEIL